MLLKSTKVRHLSLAGARCRLLVAKTASSLWATIILKCRDAVLAKVKDSISFESIMDLRNDKLLSGMDIFPAKVLDLAVRISSKVPHDEAIRKVVSRDKPASRRKKLHFSQTSRQSSSLMWSSSKALALAKGRGRNFEGFSPPSQPQMGGVLDRHWHAWQICGANEWTVVVLQQGC